MKTILVDAFNTLVVRGERVNKNLYVLLEQYPNTKIVLTNANDEEIVMLGLNHVPYQLFTLKHNPEKTNPEYFRIFLKQYNLSPTDVVYFEHNIEAVESARSVGITTFHYDKDKKDIEAVKNFLNAHIH